MFLTDSKEDADKVRKWSTQSREAAPWYQHEEIGYNYRMSNIIAGVIRGQIPYLDEHIAQKKAIYERYQEGLKDLPVKMNPWDRDKSIPNFWLSCMIIDEDAMAPCVRGEQDYLYKQEKGKSSPHEILDAIYWFNEKRIKESMGGVRSSLLQVEGGVECVKVVHENGCIAGW